MKWRQLPINFFLHLIERFAEIIAMISAALTDTDINENMFTILGEWYSIGVGKSISRPTVSILTLVSVVY